MLPLFVPLVHFLRLAAHFEMLHLLSLRLLVSVLRVTDQSHRIELLLCSGANPLLKALLVCFLLLSPPHLIPKRLIMSLQLSLFLLFLLLRYHHPHLHRQLLFSFVSSAKCLSWQFYLLELFVGAPLLFYSKGSLLSECPYFPLPIMAKLLQADLWDS